MTEISFKIVDFNSEEHKKAIDLRKEVLYISRNIPTKDYNEEEDHIQIIGTTEEGKIVATCSLVPLQDMCRMRYVAIDNSIQGMGLGSKLLNYCEHIAKKYKFNSIYCHARDTAIKFYHKNGYETEGDYFEQVTIPHIKMRKHIK